jgi:hypothetical protein
VSVADEIADEEGADELDRVRARLDAKAEELGQARATLKTLERENEALREVADIAKHPLRPPKWLSPPKRGHEKRAIVCSICSDLHLDEVINPAEIEYRNAYNRPIAEQRLERYFKNIVKLTRDYLQGLDFEGCVLMLGGDLISGDIHQELTETNEGTSVETVLYWAERLASGIRLLADEFGKVWVPCVVGNHGRRTVKPRAKRRARDSFDWLLSQMVAGYFKDDDRVEFEITDGTDILVPVYDWRALLTHGDQVSGGGGIGGPWPPLMRMIARKRQRFEFDTLVCGHWHSLVQAPTAGLIVNGCLSGYGEFSATMNFAPEPPQQALWTVSPEVGVTFQCPVFVQDREQESW